MRSTARSLVVTFAFLSALFALPATASTTCDEELPAEHEAIGIDVEEMVLPCAMVESGQLGPWCVDAAVYVLTQSGTLLCRVTLPAIDLSFMQESELSERAPLPMPEAPAGSAPSALMASAFDDARAPLVSGVAVAMQRACDPPHAVFVEPPFVPG